MVVQHNLTAMNSNRMLGITTGTQAKSTEKLSSGYKINRAADDAAGLSISEKMRKQIRGLSQASLNAEDGISAVQTAEGALNEVQDMLQRMNELAVKAANGTMSEDDRSYIQNEIDQLVTEIDRVSETTKFNETYLLKGDKVESDMPDVSGIIGGTVQEAVVNDATGNIYSNQIVSTDANRLAAGTPDVATIKYKDEDGNVRTKDISFEVGADDAATAANLVKAINEDDDLSKIFNATSSEGGKFEIASKLDGSKTDGTKNTLVDTGAITFKSASNGGATRINALATADGTIEAATMGSYELDLSKLEDGESITIDGKTYTYDANKNANSVANSFSKLSELQDLLGSDYEVSAEFTVKYTEYQYAEGTDGNAGKVVAKDGYPKENTETITATDAMGLALPETGDPAKLNLVTLGVTQGTAVLTDGSVTWAAGTHATKVDKVYSDDLADASLKLTITRKAEVEKEVNALNFSLQVGADTTAENKISIDIESMSAKSLGINGLKVDGKDSKNADAAVDTIAAAIQKVSTQRSALGAVQNRLEHTIANLDNVVENTTAAESQIRDTDMATEMVKYSNNNILAQAGQAMLAQANQANQGVLSLLG